MEGEEWNGEALGPTKRKLGSKLVRKLRNRFAPGGLLHFGQGKWYPGEQLPRWAFGCYWRKDGAPIWENLDLVAKEETDYGVSRKDFSDLHRGRLARRLYLDTRIHRARVRGRVVLPVEGTQAADQRRSVEVEFEGRAGTRPHGPGLRAGLDKVIGHVLPIRRDMNAPAPHWTTGPWFLRPETLFHPRRLATRLPPAAWTPSHG